MKISVKKIVAIYFIILMLLTAFPAYCFSFIGGRIWYWYYFWLFLGGLLLPFLRICPARRSEHIATYLFVAVLSIYVVMACIIDGLKNLILFVPYAFLPLVFLTFGKEINRALVCKTMLFVLAANFIVAIMYNAYYSLGYSGPFGIFSNISNFLNETASEKGGLVIYGRPSGFFENPNAFGFFSASAFFFFLIQRANANMTNRAGLALAILCVLLSTSRGSIIAVTAGLLAMLLSRVLYGRGGSILNGRNLFISIMLLSPAIYWLENVFGLDRIGEIAKIGSTSGPENLLLRQSYWSDVLSYVSGNPFGTIAPPQLVLGVPTDNQYIDFLAWGGVILLSVFIIYILFMLFLLWVRAKYASPASLGLFVCMVINCISIAVLNGPGAFVFWLGLGFGINNVREKSLLRVSVS